MACEISLALMQQRNGSVLSSCCLPVQYETAADGTDNLRLLGKGGFARVYLVKAGNRPAALKVPHLHANQAQASRQLCTEAELQDSLRGPYTVGVIGWYQTEQLSGVVMEHMIHGDLRSKLQELGSNPEVGDWNMVANRRNCINSLLDRSPSYDGPCMRQRACWSIQRPMLQRL